MEIKILSGGISRQMPEIKRALERIATACGTREQEETIKTTWQLIKSEMIDYDILKHANNLCCFITRRIRMERFERLEFVIRYS